jgi:hypothetical protein
LGMLVLKPVVSAKPAAAATGTAIPTHSASSAKPL